MSPNDPKSASEGVNPDDSVNEVSRSQVEKDDAPVSVSDVDKLIAFAEAITLSEQKETHHEHNRNQAQP